MIHLRYIFVIPFFLALPLSYGQAEQSPSWAPPAEQRSSYDSLHQNVLEIAPAQQEATIPQPQHLSPEDSSLQASLPDDPWYQHQAANFDDPYYQRRRARQQHVTQVRIDQQDTYQSRRQQQLTYQNQRDQQDQYEQYDPTIIASTTQQTRTYPSIITQSQAPSALWDVARIMSFAVGAQSGLVRYDRCSRQYYFAGVPLR